MIHNIKLKNQREKFRIKYQKILNTFKFDAKNDNFLQM